MPEPVSATASGFAIAAGVMALLSGAADVIGGIEARKEAKKAGKEEARLESLVTQAKVIDLEKEEEVLRGQTIAAAAGAGIKTDVGSPLTILAETAREFAREKRTIQQVGATRAAAATTRGRMAGRQATYQGIGRGVSSLGTAFSLFSSAAAASQPKGD